jgi:uncharacterized membrane protein
MYRLGCFTLAIALFLAVLCPLLFYGAVKTALVKLGVPPDMALLVFLGILIGGAINIPLYKVPYEKFVRTDPLAIAGLAGLFPHFEERRLHAVVAVNVGGCLIPSALAAYQIYRLATGENASSALAACAIAAALNIAVCWKLARPVPGVGIALPGLVPPLLAAASALIIARENAPSVAYVAGVLGPIVGADLLHLKDVKVSPVGMASIGGAGTFDGIVLSGVLATLLVW